MVQNYTSEATEAKDCPFCGSRPEWFLVGNRYYREIHKPVKVTIQCSNVLCRAKIVKGSMSIEGAERYALTAWNRRKED